MSDNISPAMLELRWDGLLELERQERAETVDEGLRQHFLLEFGVDDNEFDNEFDFDHNEFDEEMPIPEQTFSGSVPNSSPVISPMKNVISTTPAVSQKKTVFSTTTSTSQNFETDQAPVKASAEFINMSTDDVKVFIENQQNQNTLRKTVGDTLKIQKFLQQRGESREIFRIPHDELDPLLANFILSVRKADGSDYELTSLRAMMSSLDRKLKRHKYPYTVMASTGSVFSLTRDALKAKQRQLKKQGKGNKPYESKAIEDDEIDTLYNKGVLGCSTPQSLLNTMWFNNTIHFGPSLEEGSTSLI